MGTIMKSLASKQQWILVILLTGMAVCPGCRCHNTPRIVGQSIRVVVLADRRLPTGEFEAFEIKDRALILRAQSALEEDLQHPDKDSKWGLTMSVNHMLVFCGTDGAEYVFHILGDHYIVFDSRRYLARNTMAVIRAAHAEGAAVPISAEQAHLITPALDSDLR